MLFFYSLRLKSYFLFNNICTWNSWISAIPFKKYRYWFLHEVLCGSCCAWTNELVIGLCSASLLLHFWKSILFVVGQKAPLSIIIESSIIIIEPAVWCCDAGWSGLVDLDQAVFLTAGSTPLLCFSTLGLFFLFFFLFKRTWKFYFWMFWLNEIKAHHISWPALNGI